MELQVLLLIVEIFLTTAISYAGYKLKKLRDAEQEMEQKEKDSKELQLLNTRMILIREINHYLEKGFAPIYARTAVTDIYQKYHALGGNGGIEGIYFDFQNLPHDKGDLNHERLEH